MPSVRTVELQVMHHRLCIAMLAVSATVSVGCEEDVASPSMDGADVGVDAAREVDGPTGDAGVDGTGDADEIGGSHGFDEEFARSVIDGSTGRFQCRHSRRDHHR